MAGIYGNSIEDRHFERMLDNYLDAQDNYGMCKCNIEWDEEDENIVYISKIKTTKQELIDNSNFCTECGEPFDMDEYFKS